MPLYSKDTILRLRDRVDLVEVLQRHLELKRSGATFKTNCPFHEEKTPSFMIKRGDRHYHCFGCGAHGDAIQFLMQYLHLSFTEAVESLAEQFQVVVEKEEEKGIVGPNKGRLKETLNMASSFFHFFLLKTEEGASARSYLQARGINLEFIQRFEIGLAPASPSLFRKVMMEKGFTDELLQASGLLSGDRTFFRERITFPIRSPMGAIIGFSARKYKETTFGGKYINSPETPLFKKSKILFGLNYSRRRMAKERKAIIVEGQIDCLRMIEAGFDYTVASLGTAFTEEHVRELKQLGIISVITLFDGDKSGRQAISKVGHLFQKQGIDVKVALLDEGEDPDSYLRKYGEKRLIELFSQAKEYLAFQVNELSRIYDPSLPAAKTEMIREISAMIREWEDPVMVHESLKKLAKLTSVPESLLVKERAGFSKYPSALPANPKTNPKSASSSLAKALTHPDRALECDLLRWLILVEDPQVVEMIERNVSSSDFFDQDCSRLFDAFFRTHKQNVNTDLLMLLSELDDETAGPLIEELLAKKIKKSGALEICKASIQKILDRKWLQERARIQKEIEMPSKSEAELQELAKAFDRLKNERPQVI